MAAVLMAGCALDAGALGGPDAAGLDAAERDAGPHTDLDAGRARDAGTDGGTPPMDAGAPVDAGRRDAGGPPDAAPPDGPTDACVPTDEICNGWDDDCDGEVDEGDVCPCDRELHREAPYLFCDGGEQAEFDEAMARCEELGYRLVIIEEASEDGWVLGQVLARRGDWWIGLTDAALEDDWRWIDGSKPVFDNWDDGEPNDFGLGEDCGEIRRGRRAWNDERCGARQGFVCELSD